MIIPGVGTYTVDGSGNLTFVPAQDYLGDASILFSVQDDLGVNSDRATLEINVVDQCDAVASGNPDNDGDGISDICDLDDDNDGILDTEECEDQPQSVTLNLSQANANFNQNGAGSDGVGAFTTYTNATTFNGQNVDLRLTVLRNSSPANLTVDISGFSFTDTATNITYYYPIILDGANADGFAEFEIEFFLSGTNTLIEVPVEITFLDIDNLGVGEGIEFSREDISSYTLSGTPATSITLNNSTSSYFSDPGSFVRFLGNADGSPDDENLWVAVDLLQSSNIDFTVKKRGGITGYVFDNVSFANPGPTVLVNGAICDLDTDGDGLPDYLDLDSDNDGIYDAVENGTSDLDVNNDGQIDGPVGANGVPNAAEIGGGESGIVKDPVNSDGVGQPDYQVLDSDGDGCSDSNEAYDQINAEGNDAGQFGTGNPAPTDADGTVTAASYITPADRNNNSIADFQESGPDLDNDGIADACLPPVDTDGDLVFDNLDIDDDNDGIIDTREDLNLDGDNNPATNPTDTDGDGVPDYLDLDSDNDGITDNVEAQTTLGYVAPQDSNNDGIPDVTANGLPVSYDNAGQELGILPVNTDQTDNPDYRNTDSDNDGESDNIEAFDLNGDGVVGAALTGLDDDGDGFDNAYDTRNDGYADPNGTIDDPRLLPDSDNDLNQGGNVDYRDAFNPLDFDGDGVDNIEDRDDDNDGIDDVLEGYQFIADNDPAICTGSSYSFTNSALIAGTAGQVGARYRFTTVAPGLDAIVTITAKSAGTTLVNINGQAEGDASAFQPVIQYDANASGDRQITFNVRFVNAGGLTSAVVPSVGGFFQDVDGESFDREFYRVNNIVGFTIGNPSNILASDLGSGVTQFIADGTGSVVASSTNAISKDNAHRVFFQKQDINQLNFTIGIKKNTSTAITRYYSLLFDECELANYNDPSHQFTDANAPDTDGDGIPDYKDLDSDGDGCNDSIEAGFIDAFAKADEDGRLGNTSPVTVDVNGLVTSGENGQGYTESVDSNANGNYDFLENSISVACNDRDLDGITDSIDLDDDNDGILDTVENGGIDPFGDADGDGIPNFSDVGATNDANGDGVVDSFDTDGDGIINQFDQDSDGDGIPDNVEGQPTTGYTAPDGVDANNDGLDDAYPAGGITPENTDGADQPDYLDTDSDNDGIPDVVEASDFNNDGVADIAFANVDSDQDGLDDNFDGDTTGYGDPNGTPTTTNPAGELNNTDGTDEPDYRDTDDDNDGVDTDAEVIDNNNPEDADLDGTPDYLDVDDLDGDGVPDSADLDDDNDGILDSVEDANLDGDNNPYTDPTDSDGDGIPNFQDQDADGDGIPDNLEGQTTSGYTAPSGVDADGNGLDDAYENTPGSGEGISPENTDGVDQPDYLDTDSDNDGVLDATEGFDVNSDGVADTLPSGNDQDGDGIDDNFDTDPNAAYTDPSGTVVDAAPGVQLNNTDGADEPDYRDTDDDNDNVLTLTEDVDADRDPTNDDTDGDGTPDYLDTDDDGDGVDTALEDYDGDTDPTNQDTDGDGTPDYLDTDDDGDGFLTVNEDADPNGDGNPDDAIDSDANGIPNYLDPDVLDTDGDGILDSVDIDDDNDGILDVVEGTLDTDLDGIINSLDQDSDGDGIPDNVEAQSTAGYFPPLGIDTDNNGLDDAYETTPGSGEGLTTVDTDMDLIADYIDIDSDGDGIVDATEAFDFDSNGIPDIVPSGSDVDQDGLDDSFDGDNTGYGDPNGSQVVSNPLDDLVNTDGADDLDFRDTDDDNDGIASIDESNDPNGDGLANDANDADGDGIPDYLDPDNADNDGDGIPDNLDLDDDNDGILDSVEGDGDFDNDGIIDRFDQDSDNDGIPDNIEAQTTTGYIFPIGIDSDSNGLDDVYESTPGAGEGITPVNTDGDGNPDYLDVDSDNDNVDDFIEAFDYNNDGLPDIAFAEADIDNDGIDDAFDGDTTGYFDPNGIVVENDPLLDLNNSDGTDDLDYRDTDDDNDGLLTFDENPDVDGDPNTVDPGDADGDGVPDYLDFNDNDQDGIGDGIDIDDDNDGILDSVEGTSDFDNDGIIDAFDQDTDGDGIPDNIEAQSTTGYIAPSGNDADGNGLDDNYETAPGNGEGLTPNNEDGDGNPDYIDIDSDNDGVFDFIEAFDFNSDGVSDIAFAEADIDQDGLDDSFDGDTTGYGDPNGLQVVTNLVNDLNDNDRDAATGGPLNNLDFRDVDDDNDGIPTVDEDLNNNNDYADDDSDNDGIPDYLDLPDNDRDGIPDVDDLDDDNDGIPDSVEGTLDTDNDGIIDSFDLDSDNDGIPDNVEAQSTDDYNAPSGIDADNNGLDDVYQSGLGAEEGITPVNSDGLDVPDYLDNDSDNDGDSDNDEAFDGQVALGDSNNNGLDDAYETVDATDPYGDPNGNLENGAADTNNDDFPATGEVDYREALGTITGFVFEDVDGDGSYDASVDNLFPIGTQVNVTDNDGIVTTVDVNADGNWAVVVAIGNYTVDLDETTLPNAGVGYVLTTTGSDPETVISEFGRVNATTADGYQATGTITGFVFNDVDGDGTYDAAIDSLFLVGTVVNLTDVNGTVTPVTVGADGNWTADVAAGDYTVDVDETTLPNGGAGFNLSTAGSDPESITVAAGATVDTTADGYQATGTITGFVFNDVDGDGTYDAEIDTLFPAGTVVNLTDANGTVTPVTVGADGIWRADVAAGDYTVDVDETTLPNGGAGFNLSTTGSDPESITVAAGATVQTLSDGYLIANDNDNDGIPDDVDLDDDNDGIPDSIEGDVDSDMDGIIDSFDQDSDNDGIPDNVEGQSTGDYIAPSGVDSDGNGLDDAYEETPGSGEGIDPVDFDDDGLPDYLDDDSDDDGIPDFIEGFDFDNDGVADILPSGNDVDGDGLDDAFDGDNSGYGDPNGSVVVDSPADDLNNTDGDDEPDYRDIDDDGDGILTAIEDGNGNGNFLDDDNDADGTPDYLDADLRDIEIFNVLTPNNDGDNDFLFIRGIENFENNVKIYNRWGVEVFNVDGYDNRNNVFRGISEGRANVAQGDLLPVGTYYYVISYVNDNNQTIDLAGYLYINR
ncbi:T9SS type B sorting domain-containing protein [Nonlabens agnitus]|uniref:Uncharacterized protein n=1 Tax=Nonlabens agnitus TaxID=870484 RepID=A0A2S9WUX2_9FLAO|nr:gliding motility-associated C-terminal domain-containing protein [Nonlabens agnitus]PRP67259.1 hypothetical protein BST86_09165 [Nonlabens agnitus]